MVKFKPEVRIGWIDERLLHVLQAACLWSLRTRVGVEVNSIEDGAAVHMDGSFHGVGLAIDLDTDGDKRPDTEQLAEFLRRWVGPNYDIVFEGDHVHVEFDVHRGALLKKVT